MSTEPRRNGSRRHLKARISGPGKSALGGHLSRSQSDLADLLMWGVATIAETESPSAALRQILTLLTAKMWFVHAGIYSLSAGGTFNCIAQTKPVISASIPPFSRASQSPFVQAAKTRKAFYLADVSKDQLFAEDPKIKSLYVVPLIVQSKLYGVLSVHTYDNNLIDATGQSLIERFASLAALAMERIEIEGRPRVDKAIVEAMFAQEQIGAALAGLDGDLQRANRRLGEMLGCSPEDLAGKSITQLIPAEERKKFREAKEEARQGGSHAGVFLHHYVRKSGEPVWCATSLAVVRGADGLPASFLLLAADRSASKQAETAHDRLTNELLQCQRIQTLGMLAGGIAHDFNNALEVILGFASLARLRLRNGDPLQEPLKIIEESAKGAAELTHELLEAARHDEAKAQPFDVKELLDAVLKIITRTFDRKIRVEQHFETGLAWIRGQRNRFEQALLNLCLNARDAMPEGGTLTIEAASAILPPGDPRLPESAPAGRFVRITVRDTGVGMTPEVMERMYEPLYTTKPPGRNSGLGLTMVEGIIKDAGGFIGLRSAPAEGTEFVLYLPAVTPAKPLVHKSPSRRLAPGRGTVLVVDDEPRVLDFLEKGLSRLGYKVLCAQSGMRACEMYSEHPQKVACVLLDMIMPEMSGLETYSKLRDIDPAVKVILSSGYSSERVKREVAEAGGAQFLGKPYTLETLSQTLRKLQQN